MNSLSNNLHHLNSLERTPSRRRVNGSQSPVSFVLWGFFQQGLLVMRMDYISAPWTAVLFLSLWRDTKLSSSHDLTAKLLSLRRVLSFGFAL